MGMWNLNLRLQIHHNGLILNELSQFSDISKQRNLSSNITKILLLKKLNMGLSIAHVYKNAIRLYVGAFAFFAAVAAANA